MYLKDLVLSFNFNNIMYMLSIHIIYMVSAYNAVKVKRSFGIAFINTTFMRYTGITHIMR